MMLQLIQTKRLADERGWFAHGCVAVEADSEVEHWEKHRLLPMRADFDSPFVFNGAELAPLEA